MADEFDIVLHDVDEIDIDASISDEIEITLSEVDDIEIMVFDYPADIDLLTSRVKTCENNSTTAVGMAEQAVLTATQASTIAEGAATTSGEAVQSINEHASSTTNPHPTNVTQEFADTQITPLAVEATYTSTVWGYLVSLFTTVPKSVKSHVVGLWTVIENLKSRITAIETKIIADVTLSQEVSAVDITELNIKEGETVAVQFHGEQFIIPPNTSAYMYIRVNEISDNLYSNAATAGGIANYNSFRVTMRERTTFELFFTLINGKVLISGEAMSVGGTTPYPYVISGILLSSITSISSINFSSSGIGSYKAGDNIRVVKL